MDETRQSCTEPVRPAKLMMQVLDRLANGEPFDKVVEETGITARVSEALAEEQALSSNSVRARPAFVVIQEGGSSGEIYVHSHESHADAEDDRIDCAKGAYRTSRIIEIPPALAELGEAFYEVLEQVLEASLKMEYFEAPTERDSDAEGGVALMSQRA